MATITVATKDGPREVEVQDKDVIGHIAVHRAIVQYDGVYFVSQYKKSMFTLTHVPSGLSAGVQSSYRDARHIAKGMNDAPRIDRADLTKDREWLTELAEARNAAQAKLYAPRY